MTLALGDIRDILQLAHRKLADLDKKVGDLDKRVGDLGENVGGLEEEIKAPPVKHEI